MKKYEIIYADPPWMESGGGKIKRGADKHYPLMKTKEIMELQIPSAENAHLYLWVTNNFMGDGLKVMEAWGFQYKTMITWVKDRFGLGQYYRGQTEHCLFGVKGMIPYKTVDGKRQQGTTVIHAPRSKHSKKPIEMIQLIEKVSDRDGFNKLEMFARDKKPGWDVWGNELENNVEIFTQGKLF
jgi:N6-adenosine-specific RNA methylase IME4